MTSEQHAEKFLEMFPDCPNPKHHPKMFNYYINMYIYYSLKGGRGNV
jgi:hypothetical protein